MFVHKIETRRRQLGLEVTEVASLSAVAPGTIRSIERGDRTYKVNRATAEAIAYALGAPLHDLFGELELSDLGRPGARGGGTLAMPSKQRVSVICDRCYLAIPVAHSTCLECIA